MRREGDRDEEEESYSFSLASSYLSFPIKASPYALSAVRIVTTIVGIAGAIRNLIVVRISMGRAKLLQIGVAAPTCSIFCTLPIQVTPAEWTAW
mmetsp:Transcript_36914/g.95593  ORF Transcript_36914/g.95593 Transcript_36914/m.95593 type:complete len:94 (+) Transcript_36914:315-596(+)